MESKKNLLGVILARGGSKGIPRKNIKMLNGHPLIAYTIYAALQSKLITDLVVSTEDEEIAKAALDYGAKVPFMRPAELAQDHVFSRDALKHAVVETEKIFNKRYDYVIELPCVAPLRDADDIDEAAVKLIKTGADSVISVCRMMDKHPVRMKRIVDDKIFDFCSEYPEGEGSRRQDLKPCYIRNGAIYSMKRDIIVIDFTRNGKVSRPYVMSEEKSVNIDSEVDLYLAEAMIKKGLCKNRPQRVRTDCKIEIFSSPRKSKLLFSAGYEFMPHLKKYVCENFDVLFAFNAPLEEVKKIIQDRDAWLCSPCPQYKIDHQLLSIAPALRVIGTPSTGTNHIDLSSAKAKGLEVFSLSGSAVIEDIHASSEFSFTLMLSLIKEILPGTEQAKMGVWREHEYEFRNIELFGKRLGLIGCGRIGRKIIRFAKGFGMNVLVYDPYKKIEESSVKEVELNELLKESDIVSVHVALTDETRGMVDAGFLEKMKDGAYFINTSRGDVVDEQALISALESGKIKAAAVDVISNEHVVDKWDLPLIKYAREHNNLIITPHIAGATVESEYKAAKYIVDKIRDRLVLLKKVEV